MGILREPATWVETLKKPKRFSVCEFGDQFLTFVLPHRLARDWFKDMGCGRYVSLDGNGRNGALAVDLNKPLDLDGERFDLVTDFGTIEHCFDQAQCYRSAHDLLKPGGVFVWDRATQGYEGHCYFNAHRCLFDDLVAANDYELLKLEGKNMSRGFLIRGMWRKRRDKPFVVPLQGRYHKTLTPIMGAK